MSAVKLACEVVSGGGIIAYPTEAVFGLGCDPRNEEALKRLVTLKSRDPSKGLIIVASDESQLTPYLDLTRLSASAAARMRQSWPGPTTWIAPCDERTSPLLTGHRSTIAVRVSAHPIVQALCENLHHALVSTSANPSGAPPLRSASDVRKVFGGEIDYVLDGETGGDANPTSIFDAVTLEQLR